MSFLTRMMGAQMRSAVRINFYGSEDIASVEFIPEIFSVSDQKTIRLHTVMFLSYYVRTMCDLTPEYFEALKSYMNHVGEDITLNASSTFPHVLGSGLHLQSPKSFGVTRTHKGELYEKKDGTVFFQSHWSPSEINAYGPFSMMYYYQRILKFLDGETRVTLAMYVENIHDYFNATGGRPNVTKINEAVGYALANSRNTNKEPEDLSSDYGLITADVADLPAFFGYMAEGKYEEAVEECDNILEINPNDEYALANKNLALSYLNKQYES